MKWKSKDGTEIEISQMDNNHLLNCGRLLREAGHLSKREAKEIENIMYDLVHITKYMSTDLELANGKEMNAISLYIGNPIFEEIIGEINKRKLTEYPTRCFEDFSPVEKL